MFELQTHQPTVAQKVRRKYQQQQKRKQKMIEKSCKGKPGRPRKATAAKRRNSQTLTKLKNRIKKKKPTPLAVNALENATMEALKVKSEVLEQKSIKTEDIISLTRLVSLQK